MARKIAVLYYRVMVNGFEYAEKGIQHYEEQIMLNKMKTVNRLAKELNLNIVEKQYVT